MQRLGHVEGDVTPRVTLGGNSSPAPDGQCSAPSRRATRIDQHQKRKPRQRWHPGSRLTQTHGRSVLLIPQSLTAQTHSFSAGILTKWIFANKRGMSSYINKQLTQGKIARKSAIFFRNKKYNSS